jgi:hypothetical protein
MRLPGQALARTWSALAHPCRFAQPVDGASRETGCVARRDRSEQCTTVSPATLMSPSRPPGLPSHLVIGGSARSRGRFARLRAEALIKPPRPPSVATRAHRAGPGLPVLPP